MPRRSFRSRFGSALPRSTQARLFLDSGRRREAHRRLPASWTTENSHPCSYFFLVPCQELIENAVDELGRLWAVPKRLASSTASLIATRSGVSVNRIS